jgi:hypothetical protein
LANPPSQDGPRKDGHRPGDNGEPKLLGFVDHPRLGSQFGSFPRRGIEGRASQVPADLGMVEYRQDNSYCKGTKAHDQQPERAQSQLMHGT